MDGESVVSRRAKWLWAVTILAPCAGGVIGYFLGGPNAALLGLGSALAPVIAMHIEWWTELRAGSESSSEEKSHNDDEEPGENAP